MNAPTWGCPVSPDSLKHPCEFAVVEVLASLFSETALEAFGLRCFSNPKTNPARCFGCRRNFNPIDMVRVVKRTNLKDAVEYLTDTHVVEPERVQKLLALMAIAYCWCVSTGEWLNSIKPIKIKEGQKSDQPVSARAGRTPGGSVEHKRPI